MKAILFDLNGTMIDDMQYHTDAWYDIINNTFNHTLSKDKVKMEMYGKNKEVLIRVFGEGRFSDDEIETISVEKEKKYQEAFRPYLKLISGLDDFLKKAHQKGIKMAVGSAAIKFNVDFVLDGLDIREYFPVVVSAENVVMSKPDPETFIKAAELLGIKPEDCVVFEDNPKGVESARRAGMKSVVLTTMHEVHEFERLDNILHFAADYTDPYFEELLAGK